MRPRLLALAAASLAAIAATSTVPATADDSSPDPLQYAALGDSYSAASAVLPLDTSNLLCARSLRNYGHLIADELDAELTDVTCGGALSRDITNRDIRFNPPQLDAVTADTDLVTLTVGGNDNLTFAAAIAACGSAGIASLGIGKPCTTLYGDLFVSSIRTSVYPQIRTALAAIRAKAPGATVAVLGYPTILPPTKGCYTKLPVAPGDVPYVNQIQATVNEVVARAAADTGATFVDFAQLSKGHDACQPAGVRWIDPLFPTTSPIHPNALGQQEMARHTLEVLGLG
ncbi:SGNH/GDSL hydrolase family protein [Nocardioides sp. LML1-1-1.1]|uniref:SGNH/GDSL hydrolase family protein n=1 Tax=Nocardioides sp. LML1-1-1.1 TaxID=3135248 RepID=UPI00342A6BB8